MPQETRILSERTVNLLNQTTQSTDLTLQLLEAVLSPSELLPPAALSGLRLGVPAQLAKPVAIQHASFLATLNQPYAVREPVKRVSAPFGLFLWVVFTFPLHPPLVAGDGE